MSFLKLAFKMTTKSDSKPDKNQIRLNLIKKANQYNKMNRIKKPVRQEELISDDSNDDTYEDRDSSDDMSLEDTVTDDSNYDDSDESDYNSVQEQ